MSEARPSPPATWPIRPAPATAATEAWWAATRDQRLVVQACEACGRRQHHPRAICTGCGSIDDLGFVPASGRGRILSHTVVHRAPDTRLEVPYLVALVRLDEGVTMMAGVRTTDLDLTDRALDLCDRLVEVEWLPIADDDRHLPRFRLAAPA